MDLSRIAELNLTFEHIHDDGSRGTFEPERTEHASAAHDPERDWASGPGTIFRCTTCDESLIVGYEEPVTLRPDRPPALGSAAEPANDVVQDRQAPAQAVELHALVHAVEPIEEALVGVEPERREAEVGTPSASGASRRSRRAP